MKKYRLLENQYTVFEGVKHYRIQARRNFDDVHVGDIGGFVSGEHNLSQAGFAWVYDDAIVSESSYVQHNAKIINSACCTGTSLISGSALIRDEAVIKNSDVSKQSIVAGSALVLNGVDILGTNVIVENATLAGNISIYKDVVIKDNASITGDLEIPDHARIGKDACVYSQSDLVVISSFLPNVPSLTFYRGIGGQIRIYYKTVSCEYEEFIRKAREDFKDETIVRDCIVLANLMQQHISGKNSIPTSFYFEF